MREIGADIERFVAAQRPIYAQALAELRAGSKRSHWMWFVLPQLTGLGRSETARFYAIHGAGEATAYLKHPLLGPRLTECTAAVLSWAGRRSAEEMFGSIDAIKLRSSMTLFEAVAEVPSSFGRVIDEFYAGRRDAETLRLLKVD